MRAFLFILFILCMALAVTEGYSQKVGVVLSGGGPRAVTHVGVLKALEENNIPIDYITGTSMGAIVGGLYASGYTPDEIETLLQSEEMISWLSTTMDARYKYYFTQPDPNASWQLFKITYDTEVKAKLPSNIISPYKLDLGFLELFSGASAAANYNFNDLFIPFRCVASDIEANKPVVIQQGQLEKAIRASMSFPFYFKPVKIDDRLMFDGGMYNNFPVDVLSEEFKPDVIIGSKAASNYGPPEEDDIISQIQSMLMANTEYSISADSGILIVPDLWSVNVTDFSNTKSFIDSGYVATTRQISAIRKFIKREVTAEEKNEERKAFRSSIPTLRINDVQISGVSETRKVYLNRLIQKYHFLVKVNSGELTDIEVQNEIKKLYYVLLSDEKVDAVYPELIHEGDYFNLLFDVTPSERLEAEIGGLISSQAINEIFLQLQYNVWGRTALSITGNTYLGRFHNSGHFLAKFDFPTSFPISLCLSYTLNGWNYFRTKTYFFADENPSFLIQRENFWEIGVATPITRTSRLKAIFQTGKNKDEYYQDNQFTRLDTADQTKFDYYSPGLVFELNTMNRKQFPSSGSLLNIAGRYISGEEENIPGSTSVDTNQYNKYHNWFYLNFLYDHYFRASKILDLGIFGQIALSQNREFNNYVSTVLSAPAFEPLPESQTFFLPQFRAFSYAGIGLKGVLHPIRNLDFRGEAYMFQPYKQILKTDDNKAVLGDPFAKRYYIFSVRCVYHAPFGPISMGLNYYESMEEPFVFNIHIGYYIFNKRPIR